MRGSGLALMAGARMGEQRAQQQYEQQAAAQPSTDITAELQKLADLHKSGVLTDEEFAAMKKKLLGL